MTDELEAIVLGLVLLLGALCAALVDLYWRWAKHLGDRQELMQERQEWLEERLEQLRRRVDGA